MPNFYCLRGNKMFSLKNGNPIIIDNDGDLFAKKIVKILGEQPNVSSNIEKRLAIARQMAMAKMIKKEKK